MIIYLSLLTQNNTLDYVKSKCMVFVLVKDQYFGFSFEKDYDENIIEYMSINSDDLSVEKKLVIRNVNKN